MDALLRHAMDLRLGPRQPVDRVDRAGPDELGHLRLLDRLPQSGHGALDAVAGLHDDPRACHVTAALPPDVDGDLVAEAERLDHGVELRPLRATVDQRPQRHVAGDAGEAVEVGNFGLGPTVGRALFHARVLYMRTAAASIGCMLAGRFAIRTRTVFTRGISRLRSAIAPASDSSSFFGSPSITSRP